MNEQTVKKILNVLKIIISVMLSAVAVVSMLGATLIGVARNYLNSTEFEEQVHDCDLDTLKFTVNGQKITVNEYVHSVVKATIENELEKSKKTYGNEFYEATDSLVSQLLPGLKNYASSKVDDVIDGVLSSEVIDELVKSEVMSLVDYFVNTDVDEAKERLENNEGSTYGDELSVGEEDTTEDRILIYCRNYIRSLVIDTIENASGMSADTFIVLISEETKNGFIIAAAISLVLILLINLRSIFNCLLYGSFISFSCTAVIRIAQNKFDELNKGLEDLVGYVFLKPLADSYTSNAVIGILAGVVLLGLFVGVYLLFKNYVNKKEET